jgi:hypothetical protein
MPGHGNASMMWYSWNLGSVHFISYSTEVRPQFSIGSFLTAVCQVFYEDPTHLEAMLEWLTADLTEANTPQNREAQPWFV